MFLSQPDENIIAPVSASTKIINDTKHTHIYALFKLVMSYKYYIFINICEIDMK